MTVCTEANAFCQFLLDSLEVVPFADSAGNIEFFFIRVKTALFRHRPNNPASETR
jgi:hypothetical protein